MVFILLHQGSGSIAKTGLPTNPHTFSHSPAKETDESSQRNVLVELGVEFLLSMFYNCILAGCSWLQRATPQGLASLTAGSDTSQPLEPQHSFLHQGPPKHYCTSHTHFLLGQQRMLSCYCWRSVCIYHPFSSLLYLRLPGWISTLGPSLLIYRQIECDIRKEGHFPSWKPSIKCNCVVKYSFEKGFSGKRISWFHSPKLTWLVLCWNSYDTQTKPKYALVRYRGGP